MMQLLNPIRCWFYALKLRLIDAEIYDTLDEMGGALADCNFGLYRGLADFHTELVAEAQLLRAKLKSLNH